MNIGISISAYSNSDTPPERYQIIERCLDSLSEIKKKYNIYINIVNDTITENHKNILDKYDFPIINNPFNMGIAYTKNIGIKSILEQGLDYGILIDDDVIIKKHELVEKYYNGMKNTYYNHFSYFIEREDEKITKHTLDNENVIHTPYVNGCILTFTRKLIEECGYFEILPYKWGHEHSKFSLRVLQKGFIPAWVDVDLEDAVDEHIREFKDGVSRISTYRIQSTFAKLLYDYNANIMYSDIKRVIKFHPLKNNIVKYYINLERSGDRRDSFESNFPDAIRIEACDGLKLQEYKDVIPPKKTVSTPTELGCTLSHLRAIRCAYLNNLDEVIVIEDDLLNPYEDKWEKTLREMIDNRPENSNCVIFNSNNPLVYEESDEYIPWKQGYWGTACYWLNRTAMKIICDRYVNQDFIIDMNNFETSLYHQADMGILYESIDAYNYTKPLFKFLDGKNLIREAHHIQDSLINKLCDDIFKIG